MMRVAIYARYSSDAQSEQSIEDQVRICRARAEREGWQVADVYADYAISGATAERPRFQQLVADARAGRFEIILAEALDRISRDQEHIAGFHKQAAFAGVRIVTLADGDISELHVGLKGTMSALFLKDLAQKTHRGLEGRVRTGRSGGGLSYGYRVRRGVRPDGTTITGELEIVAEEATIVRRVFDAYAGGQSPRAIAKQLNAETIPGPRGGRWTASLLLGGVDRENGLLRNRLYIGERVWNRQKFIKDPNTGKRVARPNPRSAWIITDVPDLAIVERAIWDTAQARLEANRRTVQGSPHSDQVGPESTPTNLGARLAAARRPVWILSGLVRCGICQGPMSVVASQGRLGCANHVERGTCTNRRTVLRDKLLGRVLVGLKERLLAPELVEAFIRSFVAEVNAANRERTLRQSRLTQEQARLGRQMRNLLDLLKDGHGGAAMAAELRALEQKQEALSAEIAAAGTAEPVPALHPNLPELYKRKVQALELALRDPATAAAAAEALRGLIDAIEVFPGERRGQVSVSLRGDLAAFLHLGDAPGSGADADQHADKRSVPLTGNVRSGLGGQVLGTLVAGTRNHLDLLLVG